ncbi:hypothetical protein [Streptomyces sp. HB2AG]|uniref:hypothetical protein n=1 Tax=Streptomyces sp. HB2AG TaxID=2983400 RepID=UPI0022AAF887|nr:hypothetical protein [Streptomyces sp. HB2AG]MCZ2525374.1 hypothetical protein [Streptomyces sp. HB2AG]
MSETAPADGAAPTGTSSATDAPADENPGPGAGSTRENGPATAEEPTVGTGAASAAVPPRPPGPPPAKPRPRLRLRLPGRVSSLRPAAALTVGAVLGAAATGLLWFGTAVAGDDGGSGGREPVSSGPFTARGTLTLSDTDGYTALGETCLGEGGYDDIAYGAPVTVSDAAGTVVAVGSLDLGEVTDSGCSFPFTVEDVPGGAKFYTVEVSHRGGLTKTAGEMRDELAFTLG